MLSKIKELKQDIDENAPYLLKQLYFTIGLAILAGIANLINPELNDKLGVIIYLIALWLTRLSAEPDMVTYFKYVTLLSVIAMLLSGNWIFLNIIVQTLTHSEPADISHNTLLNLGIAIGNCLTGYTFWMLERHWKKKREEAA